jgi:hypothetical protein
VHFTPKDWIFAYFSFLGVGKLILAGLYIRRCRWHRRTSAVSLTPVNSFSAVSLTPAINFRPSGYFWPVSTGVVYTGDKHNSRISPRIFENIQNGPNGILMGLGALIHEKNLISKISCQTPFKHRWLLRRNGSNSFPAPSANTAEISHENTNTAQFFKHPQMF